jgi:hypothetical protein
MTKYPRPQPAQWRPKSGSVSNCASKTHSSSSALSASTLCKTEPFCSIGRAILPKEFAVEYHEIAFLTAFPGTPLYRRLRAMAA